MRTPFSEREISSISISSSSLFNIWARSNWPGVEGTETTPSLLWEGMDEYFMNL